MKTVVLLLPFVCFACASSPPPPPPQPQPMMAADNGQPKMRAAWQALSNAKSELEAASSNKGGHRENAIGLIQQAIDTVNLGMQYAASHPTEIGEAEAMAAPEPVNEVVPGSERQPHMHNAMLQLREARRQLDEAKHDKGGYRVRALGIIRDAMLQVREGINFANSH
jgi:hypothetical protein